MIISSMTTKEIIREFRNDFPEIQRRMESYIRGNRRSFIQGVKRSGESSLVFRINHPRTAKISGNNYQVYLSVTHSKKECISYCSFPYIITLGSRSGSPRAYIRVLRPECLLVIRPHFIEKLYPGMTFESGLGRYIREGGLMGNTFNFMRSDSDVPGAYNMYVDLGNQRAGLGFINEEEGRITLCDCYSVSELEKMADELGMDGELNPAQVLAKKKEGVCEDRSRVEFEFLSEEERKKKEMELAWLEYRR